MELIILSDSFKSHSMSVRWHHDLCHHASHERYSFQCSRARTKSPQAYPTCNENQTWGHCVTGMRATATLLLPSDKPNAQLFLVYFTMTVLEIGIFKKKATPDWKNQIKRVKTDGELFR